MNYRIFNILILYLLNIHYRFCQAQYQNITTKGIYKGKGLLCNQCPENEASVTSCRCNIDQGDGIKENALPCAENQDGIAECKCRRGYRYTTGTTVRCVGKVILLQAYLV